ncbi:MAG: hypothetical protein GXO08_05785 [Aquificae bacterium]|nr:hypothetical protein [Aquificota bacterium]
MDEKRKDELNRRIEEIFEGSFSSQSAWEKLKKLAEEEGSEEVYLTLLENIVDDLLANEAAVKEYLRRIGWPTDDRKGEQKD